MTSDPRPEISLEPTSGWHCQHLFYRFDRARLRLLGPGELSDGCREFSDALDPQAPQAPARLQTLVVGGHKADFGLILLDANPLRIDGVHQRLMSGPLGSALVPTWSFVSLTEVSEYLPSVEQYGEELIREGANPEGEEHRKKLAQYARRLEIMRRSRLTPDLPGWPAVCFYPMNKKRSGDDNWFLLDFDRRSRLMSEHGRTGMQFGGKVTQLVTAGLGLDDWEWGVTLWARNPELLKDIVYRMRFDEASARYAEFGPFYAGYLTPPGEILEHCRLGCS
ncbi:MAG: hydrogen peroxide-dependent heme synthase [Planctomycetota bacterium]|jgi:chlorite dismutase